MKRFLAFLARLARRNPGLLAWLVLFTGVGIMVADIRSQKPDLQTSPHRYQSWLQKKGSAVVDATLGEIGPEVEIQSVLAQPLREWVVAAYSPSNDSIIFNSNENHFDLELYNTASHECVHAIFDQYGLQRQSKTHDDYFMLVNETAAYVLGAYVAGDAWSRQGRDGAVLTELLFQNYRRSCDPDNPESMYNRYLAPGRPQSGEFSRDHWHAVLIHFAPLQLVDAVEEICRRRSDPVVASRFIARRFMRVGLDPEDKPILEEFERRQRDGAIPTKGQSQ